MRPAIILAPAAPSDGVVASDGRRTLSLNWRPSRANGTPVLASAAGTEVAPREVELPRWPASAEAALRRGGYLSDRYPDPLEPWCNCAD
ncbi:MAG: hypothetical protein IPP10_16990 [Candidatus Competibacteraceae bacterium]|nr:hypothetical protein [Candidatus Competibacteraceae bacterium]MBK8895871.1 hypothetical protein [Candidatus Competibacteraceae bacterium]MBK8962963.1 hypothetical protein [Candidatus Competibacteraceae bacterium]MBK9953101.1 hypothetical protein [Candidatus Competibacteraceae bacterium]